MVEIYNDIIFVSKDDPSYLPLTIDLAFRDKGTKKVFKKLKSGKTKIVEVNYDETHYLYQVTSEGISIPRGLRSLIQERYFSNSSVISKETHEIKPLILEVAAEITKFRNILKGMTLRDDQLLALRKMFAVKRCILQLATGSGKTEVMSAFVKIMKEVLGYIPTTVIIEPTVYLVNQTVKRMKNHDIECYSYRDKREIIENAVNICHPTSLNNDINKNPDIASKVKILIGDECHHLQATLYRSPARLFTKLEYSIGLSASAISQEHIMSKSIDEFYPNELEMIGATGPIVMSINADYYIKKGSLAKPVLFMMDNKASEPIPKEETQNWHRVVEEVLCSDTRNRLVCAVSDFFLKKDRKILILVHTVKWARMLMSIFDEYMISDYVRASYGGGRFERIIDGEFENCEDDVYQQYRDGEVKILIGTTHLYEGADIPNLDVIILAYGGKGEKKHIQGIGRALRITKTGKYAYIVDFTDSDNIILSKHSRARFNRYKDLMKIPDNMMFLDMHISDLEKTFKSLEDGV